MTLLTLIAAVVLIGMCVRSMIVLRQINQYKARLKQLLDTQEQLTRNITKE